MDQLKAALQKTLGVADAPLEAREPPPAGPAPLPDPLRSPWGERMRELGVELPANATVGQLSSRSDVRAKELAGQGRKRDADQLRQLKEAYLREREKAAWAAVKARFEELALPEKAYRALKQEGADGERVLVRLYQKKGMELQGAGAARVRDELMAVAKKG